MLFVVGWSGKGKTHTKGKEEGKGNAKCPILMRPGMGYLFAGLR